MTLSAKIKEKLDGLPDKPGVYFMRDRGGRIIYVGKAASLRSRVRSYFQPATLRKAEPKLRGLIRSIMDLDYMVLRNEAEAILTEGRMIKEYRPRYNVTFKDDKRFLLLKVDVQEPYPRFQTCRIQKKDGADYFGPYVSSAAARAALEFVERRFGLRLCRPRIPGQEEYKHCLNDIIRHCSAPCIGKVTREEYGQRVALASAFLRGEKPEYLKEVRDAMEKEVAALRYEKAAALRDTLFLLQDAVKRKMRGAKTFAMKKEEAHAGIEELQRLLGLPRKPRLIETFDISNISGTHAVASMVCAEEGVPNRNYYRRYRIKTVEGIDDPKMMAEVIRRRYTRVLAEKRKQPDLVLVDGGITQLRAARAELNQLGLSDLPAAGLAKKFEELYWDVENRAAPLRLPRDSHALNVLRQIRDEAHRFALTYHRELRSRRIRESSLDEIAGIGQKRKEELLKHFGSIHRLRKASAEAIAEVPGIGLNMARTIKSSLGHTQK